jgi:protein phosphatase
VVRIFGVTDTGCVRKRNEDRFLVDEQLGICLLADGMGGHGHGEIAAQLAVQTSHHFMAGSVDRFDVTWPFGYDYGRSLDENRLVNALLLANRQVWSAVQSRPECAGMGTTMAVVSFEEDRSAIGSVGDSRVYLLREGELRQLTRDDNWVSDLVENGFITEREARTHSMRNVVTQAIGTQSDIDVHTSEHLLFHGDVLLMATDGVYGVVPHATVRSILHSCTDVKTAAESLVGAARENGAPDNATCIVIRYWRGERK